MKMSLGVEKYYPAVIGLAVAAILLLFCWRDYWQAPRTIRDLFPAVINIAAIAIGFLAAALSILYSIDDKLIIKQLKDINYYDRMVGYLVKAINWSFVLALATTAGLLVDWDSLPRVTPKLYTVLFSVWCGLLTTSLLSYYRIVSILAKLLRDGGSR